MKDAFTYEVAEFSEGHFRQTRVKAIQEMPLTIYLNGHEIVTLLCTGKHPKFLAVGFLKSDGLITDLKHLKDIQVEEGPERLKVHVETSHDPFKRQRIERSITSGCGKGTNFARNVESIAATTVTARLRVTPQQVLQLAAELHERSTLYKVTRGCHNASLATPEKILIFREDIGRHNAIDMICGQCFLDNISTEDKLIVTTGRIASEILLKVMRLGAPILASGSAATRFSVDLARKTNMTLIGHVKQRRMVVYNHGGRIVGL
ncbi:MAG: formate dehydrogenase accessory sulfurtransferase FdhD [Deltaproteobacteria bacterium]|nr:formate dehydrogenase accessory sulfurtransferase FdhD [Deltaproteobacteria bacterium]MBW2074755.1 formate dehydrogenase accessory sulfurtransferase FdhD [Deltaproteobacteria bacterium]RLB81136.1 MAG: formate dehydrogenase accessory sulfurtransferase FdhD [Deltaproteobacteria bacterium]